MNLIYGKFRTLRHVMLLAIVLIAAVSAPPYAMGAQTSKSHVLILNSFDESSPWVQEYINGLMYHLVNVKGVSTNVRHLNSSAILNDSTFDAAINSSLDYFANNPPAGIIMMGRPAFAAREEINRRWKNIPMLYMGATEEVIPKEYEYANVDISDAPVVTLHDIRDRFNFTYIKIPDHYKKTIDMMMKMQPKMKNFKFASNSITTSLQLRDSVRQYLNTKYPNVSFEWINAEADGGNEKFKNLLAKRDLETGILLGNWYHRELDQSGHPVFSAGDVNLIDKSPQPVFTVKENYFKTGVIGGVLPVRAEIMKKSKEVIDRMLKGDDMRQIPLDKGDQGGASIDYIQLERKGLSGADVPSNANYINKPESLFSKNPLAFAVALLILISLVQLVMYYLLFKGKTESFMKRREIKINHLPVNYFIGKVNYNEDGVPVEVQTTPGNQKAIELWEKHAGECRCEPLFDEAEMLKAVARLSDNGKGVVYTEHFEKTDSYYEVNIHRGFDADTLEIFCFNITKRIKSEQDLKYTSVMLEMTLDLAKIVPWHWNLETKKIELKYNEALRRINKNLISSNGKDLIIPEDLLFSILHPEDLEKVKEIMREVIEGKRKYAQMEFRVLIPDNGKRVEEWLEVNASVELYDSEGKPEVLIGSFACITERKEQMRRLIEARETAKEADRLKSAFLANMSHEIRTPLNAIVGFSNMLAETNDPVQKKKFINIIESNNDMLLQIISDILDLSKTEAGTMEFNMRPTDINALLINIGESVVDRVKPGVDLLCNFGSQCCWMDIDPNRLSQVVINFLTNASKFTEHGSISYGYEMRGENLYFYCHDTGSGISEENQKKVFERFIKLNSFVNGTGLGLPICKAIVEFLGGQIGVSSEGEGYGSTFWFEIPYRSVPIPNDVIAPIWTEPTVNLTLQHAMSMPGDHSHDFNHSEHHTTNESESNQSPEHASESPQFAPEGTQINDPQFGPDGAPLYGPQFAPDGTPLYGPQFAPDGTPLYGPQFGPDGTPLYGPQFAPDGTPLYGPQFAPDGTPLYGPQFGPDGTPIYGPQLAPDSDAQHEEVSELAESVEISEPTEISEHSEVPDLSETSDDFETSELTRNDEVNQVVDNSVCSEPIGFTKPMEHSESDESADLFVQSVSTEISEPSEITESPIETLEETDIILNIEEEEDTIDNNKDNNSQETEDMAQQMNPNQPRNPQQGYPNGAMPVGQPNSQNQTPGYPDPQNPYGMQYQQQHPYGQPNQPQGPQQNPYGQQYPQQNPYGQQYPQQNPYGQQYPQQNPYGQQYPQQNPYGQQYPQQNPYGQQYPQQNPYGQQYPQQNPYGQQYPQQNPYGQQYPQQNPYGQQYPQQNPYGQQYPQQNPYGQQYPQQNPYGQQYPQQNPYGQQNPQQNPYGQATQQHGAHQNPYEQQHPQQNHVDQQPTQQNPYGHQNQQEHPNTQQGAAIAQQMRQAMGQAQGYHHQSPANNSHASDHATPAADNPESEVKKLKVLIAEDNESNYILYESMLAGNYELIHAWNGEEAVELFEQTKPDIILMDISMPKMDGYEATTEIKRKDALVPIIAVTAYAFATDKERMLESGFNGYVSKPINSNRLKEEMSYVLKRR